MRTLLFLLFSVCLSVSCTKSDPDKSSPRCIDTKIHDFKKTCCDEGATVKEYTFQKNTVYVFDPGTCGADMSSMVVDSDCNTIGSLGGIVGNVKINGEEFSHAVYQKTIWAQ